MPSSGRALTTYATFPWVHSLPAVAYAELALIASLKAAVHSADGNLMPTGETPIGNAREVKMPRTVAQYAGSTGVLRGATLAAQHGMVTGTERPRTRPAR